MPKYDFDSYLLYELKKRDVYSVKIRVILKEKVNGEVLSKAAEKAFQRFPYYRKTVSVNDEGAYVFEPCDKPVAVIEGDRKVRLGTDETNGLLFAITYENNDVFFSFSHNFCGGCGAMRWIKATLWQYLTDLGYDVDTKAIMTVDTPMTAEEQAEPDPASLPADRPLGRLNFTMDSFVPRMDYMERMKDPDGIDGYYPIRIPKKALMKYARDNDGSPNSILAAVLYKMCVKVFPEETKFTAGIANNYREDLGCPLTYRDIVREMHIQYDDRIKDWPVDKLSTVTRSRMYIQMQPEESWERCRRVDELRSQIDSMPDLESKVNYAFENSLTTHGIPSTFHISYVGKVDWGGLESYIDGVYSLTIAHLMLEVNATEAYFFISFHTVKKDGKYLKEFLKVLDDEGITYSVGDLTDRRLPVTVLP